MNKIEEDIKKIIIDTVGLNLTVDDINDDDFLLSGGLNLDSVAIIEIIVSIEEAFDIVFADEDVSVELFSSVKNIADKIRQKKGVTV